MVDFRVEPDVLDKAARVVDDLRDDLQKSATRVDDWTTPAVTGLAGWRTRPALEQFQWSWSDDLSKLVDYLTKVSEALHGCATDYRHSDEANGARFDTFRR